MTDPQTEQTRTTEPESGNLFGVLETHAPDSATAHAAVEEVKNMAGQNVVAQLGARMETAVVELGGRIDKLGSQLNTAVAELNGRIDSVEKRLGVLTTALIVVLGAATATVVTVLLAR